ncbi:MAG TPA: response regulator, partial [Candidatus Polarisedimenticolia bacterium]|nr:response regulator [Candidatus Polarisedimenticolia bacterium]
VLAEDGERALSQLAQERPDLLIVDVMMPKVNGFQICRKVKNDPTTQSTPVILLTGRSQQEDVFWGKDCGADEYMTKPFSTKELEKAIVRLLRRRQDQQARGALGVHDELKRRRDKGQACALVTLEWDARAMDIFRKKYGEIKFSEAQRDLREEVEKFLEETGDGGPIDLQELSGFSVVLSGSAPAALKRGQELGARLNSLMGRFYTADDLARGHIPFRDQRSGQEEKLPLVTFSPRLAPEVAG